MTSIISYQINVPVEKLDRMKQKLALTDFPDEVSGDNPWMYGAPLSDIKRLAHYWEHTFDWYQVQDKLNKIPQFTVNIEVEGFDTYAVHFIHKASSVPNAIPLLFIHGWPGSFLEVTKMLPLLVEGNDEYPAFHVVAPSLIDFGFSSASGKANFGIPQQAEAMHKVMMALGYSEYVVQGGDLGCLVARCLAMKYGNHIKAHHVNNVAPPQPTETEHPVLYKEMQNTSLTPSEVAGLTRTEWFTKNGDGYIRQQSTKPQTIGYLLTDSPIGLLAWMYEKLHDWSDDYTWMDEEILTWVSIYYFSTAGSAASSYIYYAMDHAEPSAFTAAQVFCGVPIGISRFPKDLILLPKLWNRTLGPVVYEKEHKKGGHFAAWECPESIVADLRYMFGRGGGAYSAVEGKSGFQSAETAMFRLLA